MINLVNNSSIDRVYANKGDTVVCIDNGGSYTTYDDFFRAYSLYALLERYCHKNLVVGGEYKVIGLYAHEDCDCNVYILEGRDNKIYLCKDDVDYLSIVRRKRV